VSIDDTVCYRGGRPNARMDSADDGSTRFGERRGAVSTVSGGTHAEESFLETPVAAKGRRVVTSGLQTPTGRTAPFLVTLSAHEAGAGAELRQAVEITDEPLRIPAHFSRQVRPEGGVSGQTRDWGPPSWPTISITTAMVAGILRAVRGRSIATSSIYPCLFTGKPCRGEQRSSAKWGRSAAQCQGDAREHARQKRWTINGSTHGWRRPVSIPEGFDEFRTFQEGRPGVAIALADASSPSDGKARGRSAHGKAC